MKSVKEEAEIAVDKETREELSNYSHEAWSSWVVSIIDRYGNDDGTVTIPKGKIDRWKFLMKTPYDKLSKVEKDKDREEADEIIDVVEEEADINLAELVVGRKFWKMNEAKGLKTTLKTAELGEGIPVDLYFDDEGYLVLKTSNGDMIFLHPYQIPQLKKFLQKVK